MLFWLCLIIGGLFALLGFKKGLYVAITMLFNLMIGVYAGVLAAPRVLNMSPEYGQSGYYPAATVFFLAIIIFAVLQLIAWFYFLHDAVEYFPKLIEQVGGALCGFLFGYFLLGLVTLSICMMPFSKGMIPSYLPQRDQMIQFAGKPVAGICNFIGAYSLEYFDGQPEVILETLLSTGQELQDKQPSPKPSKKIE
jgi:uncharacterized membrane protein required for colicin V production